MHLMAVVDAVLEMLQRYPEYKFTFDGQVMPLIDYLEVKPEKREEILEVVQSGRLRIGPWYTQPDEFLVSGEALIRNLLLGTRKALEFGAVMRQGYIPDAFGHIAQMPQLLRGFGIETAFVMRGAEGAAEHAGASEFLWVAPDGSSVMCHVLETGYCNAERLPSNLHEMTRPLEWFLKHRLLSPGKDLFEQLMEKLLLRSKTGVILLLNGCDHLAPQKNLPELLKKFNDLLPKYEFTIATLDDYAAALARAKDDLVSIQGEFRTARYHPILAGTLSARMYLKLTNFEVQTRLQNYAEPLAAIALLAQEDLRPLIRRAWSLVLQNHAHDSICGTCADEVHDEMMVRFNQARDLVGAISGKGLEKVAELISREKVGEASILVFNPTPWPHIAEVETLLSKGMHGYAVETPEGRILPLILKNENKVSFERIVNGVQCAEKKGVVFQDELPAFGVKTYKIVKAQVAYSYKVRRTRRTIENQFYLVKARSNGTFDLIDKHNDLKFTELHVLEDMADAGDTYTFEPLDTDAPIISTDIRAKVSTKCVCLWKAELHVSFKLKVPVSLTRDRKRRSRRFVSLPIHYVVSLQDKVNRVDISLNLQNKAKDHRLRVVFPTQLAQPAVFVDDAFFVSPKNIENPDVSWIIERPSPTFPQKLFICLEKSGNGFALLNAGMPECEVRKSGEIYLTLLRCVGWLSRGDLRFRVGHAGPPLPTPKAQCLGSYQFRYALYTYKGTWDTSSLLAVASSFHVNPIAIEYQGLPLFCESFMSYDNTKIVMSAFKPGEDGNYMVIRVYNPTQILQTAKIKILWPIQEAWEARIDEKPIAVAKKVSANELLVTLKGGEVKTIIIVPEKDFAVVPRDTTSCLKGLVSQHLLTPVELDP